jgi:putative hydrolase of the HAD superfamily
MNKVVFWDFDGTIIHPNESFLDSMRTALESSFYQIESDNIRRYLHTACTWYTPEISYTEKVGKEWWNMFFEQLTSFYENNHIAEKDRNNINQEFMDQIKDYRNYTPYVDSESTLCKCKELGYKNYILSNNFPELPFVIKGLRLSEYFNGCSVVILKPIASLTYMFNVFLVFGNLTPSRIHLHANS